mmetsp:Transcript_6562/g.11506  ORF Transcript_6562/g.11506 Transcript_6562/m.11506 type:complete len:452 (-) Transcript_6562:2057-3412(-)
MSSLKEAYYEVCSAFKVKPNTFVIKRLSKHPDKLLLHSCALDARDLQVLKALESRCKGVDFSKNYYIKEKSLLDWTFHNFLTVSLDNLQLTDKVGVKLFRHLGVIQSLSVRANKFSAKSWNLLALSLPSSQLVSLDISNNKLGDCNCLPILNCLSRNTKLERLWIECNELSVKSAQNLLSLLRSYNKTLLFVSMRSNPIPISQLRCIEMLLQSNQEAPCVQPAEDECVSFRYADPNKLSPFVEQNSFITSPSDRSFSSTKSASGNSFRRRSQSMVDNPSFKRREIEPFNLSLESITSAQITIDDLHTPENQDASVQDWRNFASPNPATVTLFGTPVQLANISPEQAFSPEITLTSVSPISPPKTMNVLPISYSSAKEFILTTTDKLSRYNPGASHKDLVRQLKFVDTDETVSQDSLRQLVQEGHKALQLALSSIESLEHFLQERGYAFTKA